jgi:hypothetical protein
MAVDRPAIVDSVVATTRLSPVSLRKNALDAAHVAACVSRTGRVSPSQQLMSGRYNISSCTELIECR